MLCQSSKKFQLKIQGYDATGKWNIDKYSPQKGHLIKLKTNLTSGFIKKIKWTFSNNTTANSPIVKRIFTTPLSDEPGEGFLTANVCVTTKCGNKYSAKRRFLIATPVNCMVQCEKYNITDETKCIKLICSPLCEQLVLGNPFEGNADYACGGACLEECPRFEIRCSPIHGTKIKKYGRHHIYSKCGISGEGDNESCIDLYKKNLLGKCAKYPPTSADVCIVPENLSLEIKDGKIVINNLSKYMLPDDAKIKWTISKNDKVIDKFCVNKKYIAYNFPSGGEYKISVKICIPKCDNTIVCENFTI